MTSQRLWIGTLLGVLGCVDIQGPQSSPIEAHNVLSEFHFTSDAMKTKVGDTLQLTLRAVAVDGSPLPIDLQNVRWTSVDSVRVYVDTLGRVIAKSVVSLPVDVRATYSSGKSTKVATIPVYVTASEELSASSLKIVALDSTRVGYGAVTSVYPRIRLDLYDGLTRVTKGAQLPITVPLPFYASYSQTGGPEKEPVYFISNGGGLGRFWVKSSVNLYGVEVVDSIEFTATYPFIGPAWFVGLDSDGVLGAYVAGTTTIAPCGAVVFTNTMPSPIEVVFNDLAADAEGCGALHQTVLAFYSFSILPIFDTVGDSVITVPPGSFGASFGIRRSATRGVVSWYLRDPVTKERLPVSGSYNSIHTE